MSQSRLLRRRRFITICAAAGGLPLLPRQTGASVSPQLHVWSGSALGADATLQIHHPDADAADRLIRLALAEVARLEKIFSLYRDDADLVRLNNTGELVDPPADLLCLLADSVRFGSLTGGVFDVTVQPLWDVYASHFSRPDADPSGPSRELIAAALSRVGQHRLVFDPTRIGFTVPGMAITLNGIAQGYITDRVVALLRANGVEHALVDMGETRAIGGRPDGDPWSIGLEDPRTPGQVAARVGLRDRAIATSGGYGTQFDAAGHFNHIFNPGNGETSWRYPSVSVVARDAATADALSTAFTLLPQTTTLRIVEALDLWAVFVLPDGTRVTQGRIA